MDSALIPKGVKRCPVWQFGLWIAANGAVLAWGVFAMLLVYIKGLNQTNMNNAYGFALWIWADLAVIALGGGAFFTGFLRYIVGKDELKNIINYAVRGWFIFWHANVHSMLTEVAFCLTVYFGVLTIEYIPLMLENRKLDKVPFFHHLSHNMHEVMAVFAATGAFLSFFHQGSLGGVPGVMFGRPFGFREGVLVWPWTFFLFTWSAAAFGPCFTILITKITETFARKKLVKDNVIDLLAKISGWMIFTYIIAKIIDTLYWAKVTAPSKGFTFMDFYTNNPGSAYGLWIFILEVGVCGVLPGLILITPKLRRIQGFLWLAVFLGVIGVCLNRWVMVLQVLAIPVLPFEDWFTYLPSWQEVATTLLPVAYGVIMISTSYRYLPIFPQEQELNPIDEPAAQAEVVEPEPEPEPTGTGPEPELSPAES
jgi:molybdopterin-containing oxidoreductase family membrane subunit